MIEAKFQTAMACPGRSRRRRAFTLIEMVVVVLILGIVAAVAVPRMFNTADSAGENATRQQLALLRTSIELYRSTNGAYPPGTDFATELQPFLRGPFPAPQLGAVRGLNGVLIDANGDTAVEAAAATPPAGNGWVYKPANGDIKLNLTTGVGSNW
ncbi:type II secretion system protein [Planctomycetaceae bacterium SH139]